MLDRSIMDAAADKLSIGPARPSDTELEARYLGEYSTRADLVRGLFSMSSPHIDTDVWPYNHIDWDAAADEALAGDSERALVSVGDHWFDGLAAPLVVA